jgi:hypothetical protein
VKGWRSIVWHADNSTRPGKITLKRRDHGGLFVEALNAVPQRDTSQKLDTLGDRLMTPVVYQNRNGTESLWAAHTVIENGATAISWYQFDVTAGNFPATPVQQQHWTNGNDGLWRWMPSVAVDANGNTAIGYSVSSSMQDSKPCALR